MPWNPPHLQPARFEVTEPIVTAEPLAFVRQWLPADATAVVERHADVQFVTLSDVVCDDRVTYIHAFSEQARCDVRAARVPDGWMVDAVREDGDAKNARAAWSRVGRHLCLGKASNATGPGTVMQEARIRPYTLPLHLPLDANAYIEFIDYYAEDAVSGDLHCVAHRVVAIRKLPHD
jgi:hypothetical protein